MVVSSSSDYFKTTLQSNNKSKEIILCLENISHEELNHLLDYVYNGEVNIEQEQLDRFLTIAQRFQLEGLISDENDEFEPEDTHTSVMNNPNEIRPLSKTENVDHKKQITQNCVKENIKISCEEFQTVEELDEKIKENLTKVDVDGTKKWQCIICNQVSQDLSNAKFHAEVHFEGLSFSCQNCDKTFRSRNALRSHKGRRRCNGKLISGPGMH